jgi:putative PIN family toxin of toxin-antitoxin system
MRLVLDTNTVTSALFWNGPPRRVLRTGIEGGAMLFTSGPLLTELSVVLSRSKFELKLREARQTVGNLIEAYTKQTICVLPAPTPRIVSDPDDDVVIGTAIAAQANLIVTGDKALLLVAEYQGVRIVSAVGALRLLTLF